MVSEAVMINGAVMVNGVVISVSETLELTPFLLAYRVNLSD